MQVVDSNMKRLGELEVEHNRNTKLMKEAYSPEAWKEVLDFNKMYADWFERENDQTRLWSRRSLTDMMFPMDLSIQFFRNRIAFLEEKKGQSSSRYHYRHFNRLEEPLGYWQRAFKRCTQDIKEAESLIRAVRSWLLSKSLQPLSSDHKSTSETEALLQGHENSPSPVSKLFLLSIQHC